MTRIKKSRTEKSIGPAKKPLDKRASRQPALAKKKGKGQPAGSRTQEVAKKPGKTKGGANSVTKDPKHGSKKPVPLIAQVKKEPLKPKAKLKKITTQPLTPEQELAQLENDSKLDRLLDRLDEGLAISAAEQQYVDTKSARHQALLLELGMIEEEEQSTTTDDIWAHFDNATIDDYREE